MEATTRSAFEVGQVVRARESVQGLVAGVEYVVRDLMENRTPFGTFVTYAVSPTANPRNLEIEAALYRTTGQSWIWVANGHLVLSLVPRDANLDHFVGECRTALRGRSQSARARKSAERAAAQARIEKAHAEARAIVATGKCPDCGAALRRNLSLTGWWQCSQFGAEGFRADASKPSCSFQTFTE